MLLGKQFLRLKSIVSQKPVCLIKPVLSEKRRAARQCRKKTVLVHTYKSGVENTFQFKTPVKRFCNRDDFIITFSGSSYDHLRTLSGRNKLWCASV